MAALFGCQGQECVVTTLRERPLAGWLTKGIAGIFYQPPS